MEQTLPTFFGTLLIKPRQMTHMELKVFVKNAMIHTRFYVVMKELLEDNTTYWMEKDFDCISICTDKFTLKEAITIINLVMEHQRLNIGWCHNVSFGRDIDEQCTVYAQESTAFGCWWNDFLAFFEKNMTNIETIDIYLGMVKNRSIDIMFNMKK